MDTLRGPFDTGEPAEGGWDAPEDDAPETLAPRELPPEAIGQDERRMQVRACMTTREDVFPKCAKDPGSHRTVVPAGEKVVIRFTGVKPGNYAIALLHDENDNGKADRAMGMMPKEGYGFSRDAPVKMAPPKFKDAVFATGDGSSRMTIKMRYFL